MGVSLLLESMAAAASVGMGCGTCCGSGISTALYGYLTTHTRDIKNSFKAFIDFFLGKFIAVILLCIAASLAGGNVFDETGRVLGIKAAVIVDVIMLAAGIWLLADWIRERLGIHSCKTCKGCGKAGGKAGRKAGRQGRAALFGMGFGYGISPCAPLILMTGYAATLPAGTAAVLGAVFALASTVSPALLMLVLSGALAKQMRKEIPQYLTWFRLGCYIILIAMFATEIVKEVVLS